MNRRCTGHHAGVPPERSNSLAGRRSIGARLESRFSVDLQPPKRGDLTQDNIFDSCGSDALDRVQWRPARACHVMSTLPLKADIHWGSRKSVMSVQ